MLKIAMIAPPWLSIPPTGYGGIEWVIYDLTEGLVKRGNEVLLFAPGDSTTSGRLIPQVPAHLGQDWPDLVKEAFGLLSSRYAYARSGFEKVDIIHDHTLHRSDLPHIAVHTLHGPATKGAVKACKLLSKTGNDYFVAISNRQRELYGQGINFAGVVHNSIDTTNIPFQKKKEDFLLFLGRSNWEKGLDLAVRVAVKANRRLIMAIKMAEEFEKEFFKKEVKPWLDRFERTNYFTIFEELNPAEKFDLYRKAQATLFTSQWEEPFGLVMVESMACGTPVLALRRGAAPEVIVHGKTGFVVDTEEEMVKAVRDLEGIDPRACRKHVKENFSVEKMVREYEEIYKKILSQG